MTAMKAHDAFTPTSDMTGCRRRKSDSASVCACPRNEAILIFWETRCVVCLFKKTLEMTEIDEIDKPRCPAPRSCLLFLSSLVAHHNLFVKKESTTCLCFISPHVRSQNQCAFPYQTSLPCARCPSAAVARSPASQSSSLLI